MDHLKATDAETHEYDNGTVKVTEFNFSDKKTVNDAEITITGRYPATGFTANTVSTALISVESGSGTITKKGSEAQPLAIGDRLAIKPGEPYFFHTIGELAIRYVAMPAWTPEQTEAIEA